MLYSAMNLFGTITWTLQVIPEQLGSMMARMRILLDDHRLFASVVPIWYERHPWTHLFGGR